MGLSLASSWFLQFKELYWGAVFFSRSIHHFHDFWSQIEVMILVTPKQEMERKSEWFCGVKFALILKLSEKKVFEQKFAFPLVVLCSHAAFWH